MNVINYDPLYRSMIGFDRLYDLMNSESRSTSSSQAYPPYNVETNGDDAYRITMAVAGFSDDQLDIQVEGETLSISGHKDENPDVRYLHHGLAGRDFSTKFDLVDHIKVVGANLVNGLLTIDLKREIPEELKPRSIEISIGEPKSLVDSAKKLLGTSAKDKNKAA